MEDKIEYFAGPNNDLDAKTIFDRRNLIFFSNYLVLSESPQSLNCNGTKDLRPCLFEGCYTAEEKCDGIKQCLDGVDERGCFDQSEVLLEEMKVSIVG